MRCSPLCGLGLCHCLCLRGCEILTRSRGHQRNLSNLLKFDVGMGPSPSADEIGQVGLLRLDHPFLNLMLPREGSLDDLRNFALNSVSLRTILNILIVIGYQLR